MRTSKLGLLLLTTALACEPTERDAGERAAGDPTSLTAPYLALGETLAADSLVDARAHTKTILAAAESRGDQPGVPAIIASVGQFPDELEPARASYRALSQAMLEYLDAHPDERAGLTLVYCPMTFASEGAYWVQREGELENPYEGSRMLNCGAKLSWKEGQAHRERWAAAQAAGENDGRE